MPKTIVLHPAEPAEDAVRAAVAELREGGVVCYPTETFYALGSGALDAAGCDRIFDLKRREGAKALPCIAWDLAACEQIAILPRGSAFRLVETFWPGPLTLVLRAHPGVAAAARDATVAVRVSGSPLARALAKGLGSPITATSANLAGAPPAASPEALDPEIAAGVGLILDGGPSPGGLPSTVIDATREPPRLLREGAVPLERLREVLPSLTIP